MKKFLTLFILASVILINSTAHADVSSLQIITPRKGDINVTTLPAIILETNYYIDATTIRDMCPYQMFPNEGEKSMDIFLLEKSEKEQNERIWYSSLAVHCYAKLESDTRLRLLPTETLKPNTEYVIYIAFNAFKVLIPDGSGAFIPTAVPEFMSSFTTQKSLYSITNYDFRNIKNSDGTINSCTNFEINLNQALNLSELDLKERDIFKLYREIFTGPNQHAPQEYRAEVPCSVFLTNGNTKVVISPDEELIPNTYYTLLGDLSRINGYYDGNFSEQFIVKGAAVIKITPISEDGSELTDHINVKPGIYEFVVNQGEELTFDIPIQTENYYLKEVRNPLTKSGVQTLANGRFTTEITCDNLQNAEITPVYQRIEESRIIIDKAMLEGSPDSDVDFELKVSGAIAHSDNIINAKRYSNQPLTIDLEYSDDKYSFVGWQSSDGSMFGSEPRLIISRSRLEEMQSGKEVPLDLKLTPIFAKIIDKKCESIDFILKVEYDKDPILDDEYQNLSDFIEYVKMGISGSNVEEITLTSDDKRKGRAKLTVTGPWEEKQRVKVDIEIKVKDDYPFEISSIMLSKSEYLGEKKFNYDDDRIFGERLGKLYNFTLSKSSEGTDCSKTATVYIRRNVKNYKLSLAERHNGYLPSVNGLDIICKPAPPANINFPFDVAENNEDRADTGAIRLFYFYGYNTIPYESNSQITEIYSDFYFYEGTEVTLTPFVRYGSGWSFFKWNDESAFDIGELNLDNGSTIKMDTDKSSQIVISESFKLKYIEELAKTEYKLDDEGRKIKKDSSEMFIRYKIYLYNALEQNVLFLMGSYDSGIGTHAEDRVDIKSERRRKYHKSSARIRFIFNDELDKNSVYGNIYLRDKGNWSKGLKWPDEAVDENRHHPGLRPDGFLPQTYHPRFSTDDPELKNDPRFINSNAHIIDSEVDGVMLSGNGFELFTASWNEDTQEGYWMTAMNKFTIAIENDLTAPTSSRIRSASGQPLMNVVPPANRKEKRYQRVTALPGIKLKVHGFELSESKHKGADLFIHSFYSLMDKKGNLINTNKTPLWNFDVDGRTVFHSDVVYYPTKADYWNNGHHFHNVIKRKNENEDIFTAEYISNYDQIDLAFFMFARINPNSNSLYRGVINPIRDLFSSALNYEAKNLELGTTKYFDYIKLYKLLGIDGAWRIENYLGGIRYVLTSWHNIAVVTQHNHPRRLNEFRIAQDIFDTEGIMHNGEAATRGDISNWGVGKYGLYQAWSVNNSNWGKYYNREGKVSNLGESIQASIYVIVGDI